VFAAYRADIDRLVAERGFTGTDIAQKFPRYVPTQAS